MKTTSKLMNYLICDDIAQKQSSELLIARKTRNRPFRFSFQASARVSHLVGLVLSIRLAISCFVTSFEFTLQGTKCFVLFLLTEYRCRQLTSPDPILLNRHGALLKVILLRELEFYLANAYRSLATSPAFWDHGFCQAAEQRQLFIPPT